MKVSWLPFFLLLLFSSSSAFSYSVRCNKKQTSCQLRTKRLTIGDYVGIFGEDKFLQAVGKITKISGIKRTLKITKKYSLITADSDARMIKDKEAANPRKYFKIARVEKKHVIGGALGMAQIGLGDGFMGFNFEARYSYTFSQKIYFLVKGNYLSGEGVATDYLAEIAETPVTFSSMGLTGGAVYQMLPNSPVSVRVGLDLGFANVSASTGEGEVSDVLRGRVENGVGLQFRGSLMVVYRANWSVEPFAAFDYMMVQSAQIPMLAIGLRGAL